MKMTPTQAKKLVACALEKANLPYVRLSAKTSDFGGFGYGEKLFVTVHGWKPNPAADLLRNVGKENGFVVSFEM